MGLEVLIPIIMAMVGGGMGMAGQQAAGKAQKHATGRAQAATFGETLAERRNPMNISMLEKVFQEWMGLPEGVATQWSNLMSSEDPKVREAAIAMFTPENQRTDEQRRQLAAFSGRGKQGLQDQNLQQGLRHAIDKKFGFAGASEQIMGPLSQETQQSGFDPSLFDFAGQGGAPGGNLADVFGKGMPAFNADVIDPNQVAAASRMGFADQMRQMRANLARTGSRTSSGAQIAQQRARAGQQQANLLSQITAGVQNRQANLGAMDFMQGFAPGFVGLQG